MRSICKLLYQKKPELPTKKQTLQDVVAKKTKKAKPSHEISQKKPDLVTKKTDLVTRKANKTDVVPKKLKIPDLIRGKAN